MSRLPHVVFWLWLHLLQFDIANQSVDPEEDARNKSWRPLPAKRITLQNARILRWALVPICLLWAASYSTQSLYASAFIAIIAVIYNDWEFGGQWFIRNILNAVILAFFEVGACLVAGLLHLFSSTFSHLFLITPPPPLR